MPDSNECETPPPIAPAIASDYMLSRDEHEEREIREYLQTQIPDEQLEHLEKLHSETVLGRRIDVWDVHTDVDRWWVLTNPTNLYSQKDFPSMDYLISFHVGLTARIYERSEKEPPEPWRLRAAAAWRRLAQAADAFDQAAEAEDFQAVGMRCRECLLEFIRAVVDDSMIPPGDQAPKLADFVGWSERVADAVAQSTSAQHVRSYLKTIAKETWQLVNWLTHAQNAVMYDAQLALDSTRNVLATLTTAVLRKEANLPDRCPDCNSYRVVTILDSDLDAVSDYVATCQSCGWD